MSKERKYNYAKFKTIKFTSQKQSEVEERERERKKEIDNYKE